MGFWAVFSLVVVAFVKTFPTKALLYLLPLNIRDAIQVLARQGSTIELSSQVVFNKQTFLMVAGFFVVFGLVLTKAVLDSLGKEILLLPQ